MINKHDKHDDGRLLLAVFADVPDSRGIFVEVGSKVECDTGAGETYIDKSPGKLSSIEECKNSCKYSVECQSITYLNTGWCSHFSTPCTNHKSNNKAVSMRWDTSGWFLVLQFGPCARDCVGIPEPELVYSCSTFQPPAQPGVNHKCECFISGR